MQGVIEACDLALAAEPTNETALTVRADSHKHIKRLEVST